MPATRRRFAACEPCRASKLACDHVRPACSRCRNAAQESQCVYRQAPFKKTKSRQSNGASAAPSPSIIRSLTREQSYGGNGSATPVMADDAVVATPNRYPNPGYLGSFSHTTLFGSLPDMQASLLSNRDGSSADTAVREATVVRGANLITRIHETVSMDSCSTLVLSWIARGSNLALAGPFVEHCVGVVRALFSSRDQSPAASTETSRSLFLHTSQPIQIESATLLDDFQAQFGHNRCRWETLGLFFTAAARAAIEMAKFESDKSLRDFQRIFMNLSDLILDIALSLDCLNDLQLILQYENWLVHSHVDGDQSYYSWKRLGDVISSLYALGYHQETDTHTSANPPFLLELRRLAFATTYSADKNVSIFLGRPPRMPRKYCKLVLPRSSGQAVGPATIPAWENDVEFDYVTDIRWASLCAMIKEDILDLLSGEDVDDNHPNVREIRATAHSQWQSFPAKFRLESSLKHCNQPPVVRDFMLNARLNQLHVVFLLRMAVNRSRPDSDPELVSASAAILNLTVEAIMQKDYLVNSGTSLVWKVAYYGLSAAGVICLWLLNQSSRAQHTEIDMSKVFQNLSVLVAEMDTGVLIETDDPNYKLLVDASKTIGSLLSRLLHGRMSAQSSRQVASPKSSAALLDAGDMNGWNAWDGHTLQDFESDFWLNLAEHPFLAGAQDL